MKTVTIPVKEYVKLKELQRRYEDDVILLVARDIDKKVKSGKLKTVRCF